MKKQFDEQSEFILQIRLLLITVFIIIPGVTSAQYNTLSGKITNGDKPVEKLENDMDMEIVLK